MTAAVDASLGTYLTERRLEVEEARLTHLAYAPEIAQAMLRRQQAEAVIAAGVGPGDRYGILFHNSIDFLALLKRRSSRSG